PAGDPAALGSPPAGFSPQATGTPANSGWTAEARGALGQSWRSLLSTRFTSYLLPVPVQYDQANKKERPSRSEFCIRRMGTGQLICVCSASSFLPYSLFAPPFRRSSSSRLTRSTVRQSGQITSSTESSSSTFSSTQTSSRHLGHSTFK